jgi:formamidopyrimidine-DNA glycosylase
MVEGHQCHRVAAAHRKLLVGHAFKATSPNGRFCEGAAAINNKSLAKIEVHGKNLFYFFSKAFTPSPKKPQAPPPLHEIVHVHFGMSGAFKTMAMPGEDPTATTRLRLENSKLNVVAHLSAMTVVHGDDEYYKYAPLTMSDCCLVHLHCAAASGGFLLNTAL